MTAGKWTVPGSLQAKEKEKLAVKGHFARLLGVHSTRARLGRCLLFPSFQAQRAGKRLR